MAVTISKTDVQAFLPGASDESVEALIKGTVARAGLLAPCLKDDDLDEDLADAAKDILVAIIVRALEYGGGEAQNWMAGPFTQQAQQSDQKRRQQRFRPEEIRELQAICGNSRGGAFTIALTYDAADALIEDVSN